MADTACVRDAIDSHPLTLLTDPYSERDRSCPSELLGVVSRMCVINVHRVSCHQVQVPTNFLRDVGVLVHEMF